MDWVNLKETGIELVKKYRYVVLVLLAGIVLMLLPEGTQSRQEEPAQQSVEAEQPALQDSLSELLSQMAGAGQVEVLLTQAAGEETIYQTDGEESAGTAASDLRRETVLLTDADRAQSGLVRQVKAPVYRGAVVLSQGADSAAVRLSLVQAVAAATGLTADKITVLKMK